MTVQEATAPQDDESSSSTSSWQESDSSSSSSDNYSYESALSDSENSQKISTSPLSSSYDATQSSFSLNTISSRFLSLRQRRRPEIRQNDDPPNYSDEEKGGRQRNTRHKPYSSSPQSSKPISFPQCFKRRRNKKDLFLCRFSSCLLLISFIIWLNAKSYYSLRPKNVREWEFTSREDRIYAKSLKERFSKLGQSSPVSPSWVNGMWPHKKKSKEDIPDGCFLQEWQTQSHPNCNLLHELDLKVLLRHSNDLSRTTSPSTSGKYLSSGMWRDVYSIPVHFEQVVLKLMKKEHDVNWRNFERHRREAIVMDVLTKSPNIVDLYSFCGNTVLTEYLPMDLENYLKEQQQAKPRQKRANYIDRNLVTTPQQRLNMAYQTAKALKDLHELDVMHADLQAKQFLVTSSNNNEHGAGDIITIKLNDFNRCRFLPRRPSGENTTIPKGSICPIHIPSAPGKARSPEEYEMKELTTQIDIYSLANVWFRILTGRRPWEEERLSSNIKSSIMAGQKPPLPDWLTFDAGGQSSPSDISLAVLLSLAYHLDPQKRATAINLVHEVERLIVTVH